MKYVLSAQFLFFIVCFSHAIAGQLDLRQLLPQTGQDIKKLISETKKLVSNGVEQIIGQRGPRTFDNTILPIDRISRHVIETGARLRCLVLVHPDAQIRRAARAGFAAIKPLLSGVIYTNRHLYRAVRSCVREDMSPERAYYYAELVKLFEQSGVHLPPKKQTSLRDISRRLTKRITMFEAAISRDVPTVPVAETELEGLDTDFVQALPRDTKKLCLLSIDKPTYQMVKKFCTVSATREKIWVAYHNRAYPANKRVLDRIVLLSDRLAQLLGFTSYTEYALATGIGQDSLEIFLGKLDIISREKYDHELSGLRKKTGYDGLIKPWDIGHLVKRADSLIGPRARIHEFFPAQQTIPKILSIFGQFLGLSFRPEPAQGLWHSDVEQLGVYDRGGLLRGHLLLDLYPRANKFSRSCKITLRFPMSDNPAGKPAVVAIIANFPHQLQLSDLRTFCHELGHAVQMFLELPAEMSPVVKTDFGETIARFFGEWMSESSILTSISGHYKTGKPIDAATIERLFRAERAWSGRSIQRKLGLSQLCLDCFGACRPTDLDQLVKDMYSTYRQGIGYDPRAHPLYSFGYLVKRKYGPAYGSYLQANVLACDLFAEIKRRGLTPKMGQLFVETVLSTSNTRDPKALIRDFLGREPNLEAFKERMGFYTDCAK